MSEWNGKGLPPVGVWCEAVWECDGKVEMICPIFISDYTVVFEDKSGYERHVDLKNILTFRPIKSEADRKRDEAVLQLYRDTTGDDYEGTEMDDEDVYSWCKKAINEGYRKVNELTDEQITHKWMGGRRASICSRRKMGTLSNLGRLTQNANHSPHFISITITEPVTC